MQEIDNKTYTQKKKETQNTIKNNKKVQNFSSKKTFLYHLFQANQNIRL